MSFPTRSLSTRIQPGNQNASTSGGQSPALVARIAEKKVELDNLRQLRDLSAAVATQMEALEQKLSTLSDGTEAIATVISNWHNVLRAINMASAKLPKPKEEDDDEADSESASEEALQLPQTLVRIPTEHAPALQAQTQAEGSVEGES